MARTRKDIMKAIQEVTRTRKETMLTNIKENEEGNDQTRVEKRRRGRGKNDENEYQGEDENEYKGDDSATDCPSCLPPLLIRHTLPPIVYIQDVIR